MTEQDSSIELHVEGMKCGGCVSAVEDAIKQVAGVSGVTVSLEDKQASVQGTATTEALIAAVQAAGYSATPG